MKTGGMEVSARIETDRGGAVLFSTFLQGSFPFFLALLSIDDPVLKGRNIFDNQHKAGRSASGTVRRRLKGKTGPLSEKLSGHFPLCSARYVQGVKLWALRANISRN